MVSENFQTTGCTIMRDLIRTRKQAMDAVKVAKQQLLSFLLRHGLRYENGSYWTNDIVGGWPNCAASG